jgi:nicotinate dehydrogenase subunit A
MPQKFSLTINGQPHEVEAEPDTPLLYVLRNDIALNGAKFGCGLGQCGACTVIVGSEAVRSCLLPLAQVKEAKIVTIEGLGSADRLHPLQRAFLEEQAAQCGYCINGMIMTARAFLARKARPSAAELRQELAGNLCRCGTHERILRAISRAVREMSATEKAL